MNRLSCAGLFFMFFSLNYCICQKVVQLEKAGTLKTTKLYIGDEITFQLKGDDKGWYERIITDIDVENKRIICGSYLLPADSVFAISLRRKAALTNILGGALQIGGINLILFSFNWAIFEDRDMDWTAVGFGAANIALGTLLRSLFKRKVFKPGKRKRIRLLDLTFYPASRT